jgi:hypothetical protein
MQPLPRYARARGQGYKDGLYLLTIPESPDKELTAMVSRSSCDITDISKTLRSAGHD